MPSAKVPEFTYGTERVKMLWTALYMVKQRMEFTSCKKRKVKWLRIFLNSRLNVSITAGAILVQTLHDNLCHVSYWFDSWCHVTGSHDCAKSLVHMTVGVTSLALMTMPRDIMTVSVTSSVQMIVIFVTSLIHMTVQRVGVTSSKDHVTVGVRSQVTRLVPYHRFTWLLVSRHWFTLHFVSRNGLKWQFVSWHLFTWQLLSSQGSHDRWFHINYSQRPWCHLTSQVTVVKNWYHVNGSHNSLCHVVGSHDSCCHLTGYVRVCAMPLVHITVGVTSLIYMATDATDSHDSGCQFTSHMTVGVTSLAYMTVCFT